MSLLVKGRGFSSSFGGNGGGRITGELVVSAFTVTSVTFAFSGVVGNCLI